MSKLLPKKWFAVDIEADFAAAEAIEYAFNTLDALGTEIDHLRRSVGDNVKVTGYFKELPGEDAVNQELGSALVIHGLESTSISSVSTREVEDADWLAEWKRHWKPTEIGRFVIAPPWSDVPEADKIVIRIEPNMAFGTGTHETTQLCLNAIDENYHGGQTFLDVGTGTGILAIAAAKLRNLTTENTEVTEEDTIPFFPTSVSSVNSVVNILACDTDADSVKIAKENAVLNGVGGTIEFINGPITAETPAFDFVCANLTIDVILPILPLLVNKATAILLLSGILTEQEEQITDELFKLNISNYKLERSGEWISVLIRFNQAS